MVTMTMTRMMGSLTTEISRDGVETLDTPFGSRRYIPSWVSSNFRWQSASIASIIQVMLMVWGVLIIPDDDQDG